MCHRPAACLGSYEGHAAWGYSCDVCCGHGNEDGRCFPLADIPDRYLALVKRLVDSEEGHPEAAERAESAEAQLAAVTARVELLIQWLSEPGRYITPADVLRSAEEAGLAIVSEAERKVHL
jgi:hypothetical protein